MMAGSSIGGSVSGRQTTVVTPPAAAACAPEPSVSYIFMGDAALAVWTKPSEAYLLELSGRCPDLEYAMAISITQFGNRVSARFDDVLPLGAGTSSIKIPCRIQTIRPLDVKALWASEKELREASAVERETKS